MIFEGEEAVLRFVELNSKSTPKWVTDARDYSKELCAIVEGENFIEELINKIDGIESDAKAKARKKYSRDLRDMFSRISAPIQNVFSATGGVKDYTNGDKKLAEASLKKLITTLENIRDNKSIEKWIETKWLPLYHTDPAGVIWMQYRTDENDGELCVYPTYQSIGVIRNYDPDGQCLEYILYEPKDGPDGNKIWVLVDDEKQYTVIQKDETFTIDIDPLKTFEHPFGECPAIIISDITDKYDNRKSPFDIIVPAAKEYARDLSMKTITKALHGSIIHWRREAICAACHGTKKNGDGPCEVCSKPTGQTAKQDVTDRIVLPFSPDSEVQIKGDDMAGFVSPDTKTWAAFTEELERGEDLIYKSIWGVPSKTMVQKTATEIHYDMQPQIQRLNKYADTAEWLEWKITEWIANFVDPAKPKDEQISLIVYGRRYILEGIDTIQKKYEDAKASGENSVVLDGIFDELLTVKFKNDISWMKIELMKSRVEPYLHLSTDQVNTYFGVKEVARKVFFQSWWKNQLDAPTNLKTEIPTLQEKFKTDFEIYYKSLDLQLQTIPPPSNPAN